MRPQALDAPFEFFFALLMAVSPIVGAIWVTPDVTKWIVAGVGVVMTLGVILAALYPARRSPTGRAESRPESRPEAVA